MILLNIGVLALVAWGTWWLTGLDKTVGGESTRTHYVSRTIRCAAIVWLAGVFLWFMEDRGGGYGGVVLLLIIPPSLALLLRSAIAEIFTQRFLQLVDPTLHDSRPIDLGKSRRYQDTIAHLIHNGRKADAIRLCEELKKSGEVELATLEMTLEFLGVKQERSLASKPLAEPRQLQAQGKFTEAEQCLKTLLIKNPADMEAAIMLVRLYAQDFRLPGKAEEILRQLERQPHVSKSHIEFARRSIVEWSQPQVKDVKAEAPPKIDSVDELLSKRFIGSAIELLEEKIQAQPQDFELQLKLMEVHAVYCHNFQRAEKLIHQLEAGAHFSSQQIATAKTQLKAWSEVKAVREA